MVNRVPNFQVEGIIASIGIPRLPIDMFAATLHSCRPWDMPGPGDKGTT
jgi:hypothetical protein